MPLFVFQASKCQISWANKWSGFLKAVPQPPPHTHNFTIPKNRFESVPISPSSTTNSKCLCPVHDSLKDNWENSLIIKHPSYSKTSTQPVEERIRDLGVLCHNDCVFTPLNSRKESCEGEVSLARWHIWLTVLLASKETGPMKYDSGDAAFKKGDKTSLLHSLLLFFLDSTSVLSFSWDQAQDQRYGFPRMRSLGGGPLSPKFLSSFLTVPNSLILIKQILNFKSVLNIFLKFFAERTQTNPH